ncbi:hypothetical protein Sjap_004486 [Stephania japonica]|uniref:Transcription termination factor MTEF18, mitochondrial-like n=1 Tax=Stephania japonica TaxID=461633 RepID=A0AAP0K2C1_9MAGN
MHFFPKINFTIRHYSTLRKLPKLRKIPIRRRSQAILQAQQALTEYLHSTRSLPFTHAENISKNSLVSLSDLISKVDFSPQTFSRSFPRFLRYHPINEFEFFFESIGIPCSEIEDFLRPNEFFLSENANILNVACVLCGLGFPWNQLGKLYREESLIFDEDPDVVSARIDRIIELGFGKVSAVGVCLAFPFVLSVREEVRGEIDELLDFLKRAFVDCGGKSLVEGNVDACCEIFKKVKFFYDLAWEKEALVELMSNRIGVLVEISEEVLVKKFEFFSGMSASKEDIGIVLLRWPEILGYDLESPVFSVEGFLTSIGLSKMKLDYIYREFPFVLGKNKLENLPYLLRAIDLHELFFEKIMNGDHHLLANVDNGSIDEEVAKGFEKSLERIRSMKNQYHMMAKLNFLLGIGFGENLVTIKALSYLHGTRAVLQERFDTLLNVGIQYSNLCKIVKLWPKVLNQKPDILEEKVSYLQNDLGCSLQDLDVFPGFLCFDLENRIKPRCEIHLWLSEKGLVRRHYSIASMIATSEKKFIVHLYRIHPAAPKQWLEYFSSRSNNKSLEG